jgi:hypothetical protein
MRYSAAKLHLVAAASAPVQLHVGRGDATSPNIRVDRPALYTVVDGTTCGEKLIEIQVMSAGTALHSVTFG